MTAGCPNPGKCIPTFRRIDAKFSRCIADPPLPACPAAWAEYPPAALTVWICPRRCSQQDPPGWPGRNVQVYILQDRRGAVAIITKSQVLHRQDRLGICHNIVPFFTKVVRPAQTPARRGKRRSRKPLLPKTANRRVFSALAGKDPAKPRSCMLSYTSWARSMLRSSSCPAAEPHARNWMPFCPGARSV